MNKYWAVAKHCFRIQIIYRYEVIMNLLEIIGRILFAWLLWGAVFAGRETVGGFTFTAMLFYYVLSSFLSSLDISSGVSGEISARIRDGTFSRFMVIPTNTQGHFIAQNMGTSAFYALFASLIAGLCASIFKIDILLTTNCTAIICALLMILIGLLFMVCFHFFIGTLTFKFQDIGFFLHIQGAILEFVTGGVVPLILLPSDVIQAMRFIPFIHVVYTPVMLLMGKISLSEGFLGLVVLAAWTAAMAAMNQKIFKRLRIKYDGVGI